MSMPKRPLAKALEETRTSKTSTRSLANNAALCHPEDMPGYSPPTLGITEECIRLFESKYVQVYGPRLVNGSTQGYVYHKKVYTSAGIEINRRGEPQINIWKYPLHQIRALETLDPVLPSNEMILVRQAIEVKAQRRTTLPLRIRIA